MLSTSEIEVRHSIDHLFRRHAGQMVSILSRIFGLKNLDLIEDAVQDALIAAMKTWPFSGVPANDRAWLIETARNRVIDRLRHSARSEAIDEKDKWATQQAVDLETSFFEGELPEDELRMIFACCHETLAPDSQVALTLKIVGGFSVSEIARAFLARDEAVAKMLARAKKKLRSEGVPLEIPASSELGKRLDSVLKVLYLIFNEGHAASSGDELVRTDLCFEAIRLGSILASHPVTRSPRTHAVIALFLFQAARLPARTDASGELLLMADQDRDAWDKQMLAEGLRHFRASAAGTEVTNYHLEAEIAALHTLAPDFASTDWRRIVDCYDLLQQDKFSPVIELNRIIALGEIDEDRAAADLSKLEPDLSDYNLYHITNAYFLDRSGSKEAAERSYLRALELTDNETVKRFIEKKIEAVALAPLRRRI